MKNYVLSGLSCLGFLACSIAIGKPVQCVLALIFSAGLMVVFVELFGVKKV
jgi:hypothetical protein